MRLKPIPKRAAQHARAGARRAAFHHIMLVIEKIRGIAFVKRERPESSEGTEGSGGPFPAVREHSFDSKSAGSSGKSIHREWVPLCEIEISMARARSFRAPRIRVIGSLHCAV